MTTFFELALYGTSEQPSSVSTPETIAESDPVKSLARGNTFGARLTSVAICTLNSNLLRNNPGDKVNFLACQGSGELIIKAFIKYQTLDIEILVI